MATGGASGSATRILIIEDEPALADAVAYNLRQEGYTIAVSRRGQTGLAAFRANQPHLVLLDIMLPDMSGLDVCQLIRRESHVPVIMLTARDGEADTVAGLEVGADDYVTKPFSTRELVSRVRAQLRRAGMSAGPEPGGDVVAGGDVVLDASRHEVRVRGETVDLRPKEFQLLEMLLRAKGRLLTREILIDEIWGPHYFGDTKTLDVHVKRLRAKIETDPRHPTRLVTVRGLGYKFADD